MIAAISIDQRTGVRYQLSILGTEASKAFV